MTPSTEATGGPRAAAGPGPGTRTAAEVVAAAAALAPGLRERQEETEKRTYYAEDTHAAFDEAGLYRILTPRRYGGLELGLGTFMEVVLTLTRACPSTGWMYCLGHAHAHAAATLLPAGTQERLFAGGRLICPATVGPSGTAARVPGGWRLDGVWPYCSGSPYATHVMGHTLVEGPDGPAPMLFVAPREIWTRLDDWGSTLGLRGSGSHSVEIHGVVPEDHTLPTHLSMADLSGGAPGAELHGAFYAGGLMSFMVLEDAVLAVGMARAALDEYEELMRTRSTIFPPIGPRTADPDFQRRYGEAAGLVGAAEAAFRHTVGRWEELAAGPGLSGEEELRIATVCREIVRLAWTAVEGHLVPTAGSSAVRAGARMERIWRDMSMLHGHAGVAVFLSGIAQREYARARFGAAA